MNNAIGMILAVTVGVLLIGTLAVPTISGFTDTTRTYTNEGMPYAAVDDDTHTIVVTATEITVDGEEIDQTLFPSGFIAYTIIYGENSFIRYYVDGDGIIQYCYTAIASFEVGDNTITITITGDSATITTTADSTSATMSDVLYYVSAEGTYVLSNCPSVTEDSIILGAGHTAFPPTVYTIWAGTIEDVTATVLRITSGTAVVSSTEVNTTNTASNLYRIDSVLINYVITINNTDYDATSTYTYFLAPATVVYDNPDYVGSMAAPILLAVITLLVVAMVVVAARGIGRD